jgi:hypothetical protein
MTNLRIIFLLPILTVISIKCSNDKGVKRVKIDNSYVEANFIDEKTIDGKASYYDSSGTLYNVTTYRKGIKDGISVNYYSNKTVSDSVEYKCGKESGYWRHYDLRGNSSYGNFYYYGLQFGPELIFKDNKLEKFLFSDLNRKIIVACNYDSNGEIDTSFRFTMQFSLKAVMYEDKSVLNLFGCLPKIPHAEQSYSIGITNKEHSDKELVRVTGHEFLIDTLLAIPPTGWHYYIGCNLEANNGSINKFYVEELIY